MLRYSNRRWLCIAALSGAVAALLPWAPASACSCGYPPPEERLEASDAAFIGTVVGERYQGSGENRVVVFTFEVEETFKGGLSGEIEVSSGATGSSCDIHLAEWGERLGVFATEGAGGWSTSYCSLMSPHAMWEAFGSLPEPDGEGSAGFVVGGDYSTVRTLILDQNGRTLAYGRGRRPTNRVAICPGGMRALEVAAHFARGRARFTIRDLRSFEVVRSLRLPFDVDPYSDLMDVEELECRSSDGERAYIQASDTRDIKPRSVLVRVRDGRVRTIYRGAIREGAIGRRFMYMLGGFLGKEIGRVHLRTGEYELLGKGRANTTGLTVAPDESYIAFHYAGDCAAENPRHAEVMLLDLTTSPPKLRQAQVEPTCLLFGDAIAIDEHSFVFLAGASTATYDTTLNILGQPDLDTWIWNADVGGGYLFGVNDTSLVRVSLTGGEAEIVRRLPGYASWTVAVEG